jgi:gamma-glutamylcyclotransferase (GGCT)/AIG2-like uncharacterized protein YtfP
MRIFVIVFIGEKMFYFAYGSNMSEKRIKYRIPNIIKISQAILFKHKLKFHKKGKDSSAKCDAFFTGDKKDFVLGVLYEIGEQDKKILDNIEGLGQGYDEKIVEIRTFEGKTFYASTYIATDIDMTLKPFSWYVYHVLKGALENSFPIEYVNNINSVESIIDVNKERERKELLIYRKF